MLYQLPSGKTIHLSIDEYLNLSDSDIQYMVSCNYGEVITNPMYGSAMKINTKEKEEKTYDFSDYHNDDDPDEDIDINPNDIEEMQ
jgi:hypothetical protein